MNAEPGYVSYCVAYSISSVAENQRQGSEFLLGKWIFMFGVFILTHGGIELTMFYTIRNRCEFCIFLSFKVEIGDVPLNSTSSYNNATSM